MNRREAIQAELYAWRAAERALAEATNGNVAQLRADVERHRTEYHRLTTDAMVEHLELLKEAETRRANSIPSTPEFHEAVRDTLVVAQDIWEEARRGDLDTPRPGE